jgi:hypothetical protein
MSVYNWPGRLAAARAATITDTGHFGHRWPPAVGPGDRGHSRVRTKDTR